MEIRPIAHIRTDFPEKFGVPRQSGLATGLPGSIIFEEEFRNADALRGLEGFDRIWLIWEFSHNHRDGRWSALVRPPRLGGNATLGVFATRSPFRPNPLGLSCVEIDRIETDTPEGPVIRVLGADLVDGTPIYDIKPYVAYADAFPEVRSGFVDNLSDKRLEVSFRCPVSDPDMRTALEEVLSLDPRPSYQNDPERVYGLSFRGHDVHFKVKGNSLEVIDINKI